ncbi:hypothetical protein [Salinimicrobium oceani]|jgi:hypothetical protein|uniref:Uncharacterized protein n=1 Tax=Salinimicrobium oceani TaxID=2722702 RepID=A0ABX1CZ38_9FLAO|nr:hypothetical protein [Salinimicrobium oceani]NJW53545.1 hypothetical protein [Salinimicrobium oceani]
MRKVHWKTLRVVLPVGETNANKDLFLDKGERIVTAVAVNQDPGQLVSLGLFEGNQEVSTPMNVDFWKRSNAGQYLDGFKPIEFTGGSTITARITTSKALATATDLEVEIVFGIIQEDKQC